MSDAWSEQHAPRAGDWIHTRDPDTGEVHTDDVFEVIENQGPLPAERYADTLDWKMYWSVLVQCPRRCPCEGMVTADGKCRHVFLLAAGEFVRTGAPV